MPRSIRPKPANAAAGRASTAVPAPAIEELMCHLMGAAKSAKRFMEQRFAENNFPAALTGPRMGVLFHVRTNGGLRMGDLADRLGVAPRTVTDLVDGLERDGLLLRRPDPADRRATLLELTPDAVANFDRAHAISKTFLQEIFSPLAPAERRELRRLLSKLERGPLAGIAPGAPDSCRNQSTPASSR